MTIVATGGAHTHLPIDEPAPLLGILGSCVELQACATRADIDVLADHTNDPEQQAALRALTGSDDQSHARYRTQVREPGLSILDLLERYPACRLPFPEFLDLLPALAPRYYSISSSPRLNPRTCSITEGVLRAPARCGVGVFNGVCSTYLQDLEPGSTVFVFGRQPTIPFRPPVDPSVPMIMVGAGTGLAPFRGSGVRSTLREIHAAKTSGTADEAEAWLAGLRREHRYLEDIWGAN